MRPLMELAERGIFPDSLIRLGIRLLDRARLRTEARPDIETELRSKRDFLSSTSSPTAATPTCSRATGNNWTGRTFFPGGMMPSDDLILFGQDHMAVEKHWRVDGRHYRKTAEAWLANMDSRQDEIMPVMTSVYGPKASARWFQRWRIFFMACAELWGFRCGQEWLVSHCLLRRR